MKIDDFLLFEEHSTKWTKNTPKCRKQRESTFLSLVTTTLISGHSCKISSAYFKFLKLLRKIPNIGCMMA